VVPTWVGPTQSLRPPAKRQPGRNRRQAVMETRSVFASPVILDFGRKNPATRAMMSSTPRRFSPRLAASGFRFSGFEAGERFAAIGCIERDVGATQQVIGSESAANEGFSTVHVDNGCRASAQHRHGNARQGWLASSLPSWLDNEAYLERIQPRLATITYSAIASALGVSLPYATDIRAGRRLPHPRH
jgi:hypothetical protein